MHYLTQYPLSNVYKKKYPLSNPLFFFPKHRTDVGAPTTHRYLRIYLYVYANANSRVGSNITRVHLYTYNKYAKVEALIFRFIDFFVRKYKT